MHINDRIEGLVQAANLVRKAYFDRNNYTHEREVIRPANLSGKWCKLVNVHPITNEIVSVYCFVALQDFTTKMLGQIKAGDIHKAASFKAPAKKARGSVFQPESFSCVTEFGVQ